MALSWNVQNVKNDQQVCWVGKGKKRRMNPVTDTLIWMTALIGMHEITEKNYKEFFKRTHFYENIFGAHLKDKDGKPRQITMLDVYTHVGLHTNANSMSNAKFAAHLWKNFAQEEDRRIRFRETIDGEKKSA